MPEDLRTEADALEGRVARLAPEVARGERAEALLEHELLKAAFTEVRDSLRAEVLKYAAHATEPKIAPQLEKLGDELKALDAVETKIRHHIETGKIRGHDLSVARSRLEQLRGYFSRRAA